MTLRSAYDAAQARNLSLASVPSPGLPVPLPGIGSLFVPPTGESSGGKPNLGVVSNRFWTEYGGMLGWAETQVSKIYGPYNPLYVDDFTLAVMAEDWSIRLAIETIKSAYHGVEWLVEGPSAELNALVRHVVLRHMAQWVEALLLAVEFGRSVSELVWDLEDIEIIWHEDSGEKEDDGSPRFTLQSKFMPGAYSLKALRDLDPFYTQILQDAKGDFAGISTTGGYIPPEKIILSTQDGRFGNLYGRATQKSAVRPWRSKLIVYLSLDRYLEQKGNPPLVGTAPDTDISTLSGEKIPAGKALLAALANLRGGGVHVIPAGYDPVANQPLYSVRVLEVPARAQEFIPYIQHLEAQCFIAAFVPPSLLGVQNVPYSGAKPSERAFYASLDKRKKRVIIDPINEQIIPRVVRANAPSAKPCEYPRLRSSDIAENAKEVMSELLRAAIALNQKGESGTLIQISSMIDWAEVIETLGLPRAAKYQEVVAPAPPPGHQSSIDIQKPPAPRAVPGRPDRIAPEPGPDFPSRPGLGLAMDDPDSVAEEWLHKVLGGLKKVDDVVLRAERMAESEREALQARVRNSLRRAASRAKCRDGDCVDSRNRTLADEMSREVESILDEGILQNLLDKSELKLARGPRSPLASAHLDAVKAASETLGDAGATTPSRSMGIRIAKDVVRDGNRNGRGVVIRETRRVAEGLDRQIIGNAPTGTIEAWIDNYELPAKDYISSTVDHVRATARSTLAWDGAQKDAKSWAVLAGPDSETSLLENYPSGQASDMLYTVKTTKELDAFYKDLIVDQNRPVTNWRTLGVNFGSPEMYVPIPNDDDAVSIELLLMQKRKEWNDRRKRMQTKLRKDQSTSRGNDASAPV